jgi:hypothetical protein
VCAQTWIPYTQCCRPTKCSHLKGSEARGGGAGGWWAAERCAAGARGSEVDTKIKSGGEGRGGAGLLPVKIRSSESTAGGGGMGREERLIGVGLVVTHCISLHTSQLINWATINKLRVSLFNSKTQLKHVRHKPFGGSGIF